MTGLFPYLLENQQFQILIANMGLKEIGKGGDNYGYIKMVIMQDTYFE